MKLEFILKVEVEVEVGVFSYVVEVEVWEGAQAAQNASVPSYLVECVLFMCTTTLPMGFDPLFLVLNECDRFREGLGAPKQPFYERGAVQGPLQTC